MKSLMLAFLLLGGASAVLAAESRGYAVFQVPDAPVVDGAADDVCWQKAPWTTGYSLLNGGAPTAQTSFAMLWCGDTLYVAMRFSEPNVQKIVADHRGRDEAIWDDDSFEIFLTSAETRKPYLHFCANSIGAQFDEQVQDASWNGKWRAAGKVGKDCWTAEVAIPFATLGVAPSPGVRIFGNLTRTRRAHGGKEYSSWTPMKAQFHSPEQFATFELKGPLGSDAVAVEEKMDGAFRASVVAEYRKVMADVEKHAELAPRAARFPALAKRATDAQTELKAIRDAAAGRTEFDAAASGLTDRAKKLAAQLAEFEYDVKIEELLSTP